MPRPGPRPYECVKRVWHSETHKPIRGSIIQRILRVGGEAHSPVTRKNREWQIKFPGVVMRAEEILYSKADSEAEYMDPDTLWERLNEAIDTIIRRDESTETGNFLKPCIEAALVLGCVPVKASRSEQNKNPKIYLKPKSVEDIPNKHTPLLRPPLPPCNQSTHSKNANQSTSSSSSPLYPLYYGNHFQNVESHIGFQSPQNSEPKDILIGRPVGWPSRTPAYVPSTMNLLPDKSAEMTTGEFRHGKITERDCDLSLRLGPKQESGENRVKTLEFCFFPGSSASGSRGDLDIDPENEGGFQSKGESSRKRKPLDGADHKPGQFDGESRWPSL